MRASSRCSIFVVFFAAACGGAGPIDGAAEADVSAAPQARLVHSLPPGSSSTASFRTLPNASCTVRPADEPPGARAHLKIYADDDGVARLHLDHVDPAQTTAQLALDCVDDAGRSMTHALDVRIDAAARPQAPAHYSTAGKRTLPPLAGDPMAASAADLAARGYPPRPDPAAAPAQFARWRELVSSAQTLLTPHITDEPTRFHGPAQASIAGHSNNWSGYVITTPQAASPFGEIFGGWRVPRAYAESGFFYLRFSSFWVGMDGYGTHDVVQAGTEQNSETIFGVQASSYGAWTEWYPFNMQSISNFPVNPGDEIYTWVWVGTQTDQWSYTGGYGWYYLWNKTQSVVAAYLSTKAPDGVVFDGHQAEWIMERPTILGSTSSLANYSSAQLFDAQAWDFTGASHGYQSDRSIQLSMVNGSDLLSTVAPVDSTTMQFTWHGYN